MVADYCANREQMSQVIQECVDSGNHDVLQIFLNDCVSKIFDDSSTVTQCFKCSVQYGIAQITIKHRTPASRSGEFVGAS